MRGSIAVKSALLWNASLLDRLRKEALGRSNIAIFTKTGLFLPALWANGIKLRNPRSQKSGATNLLRLGSLSMDRCFVFATVLADGTRRGLPSADAATLR